MYKCVSGGRTSFQEQPCDPAARQTVLPHAAPPEAAPRTTEPAQPSDQDNVDALEAERLRKEAEFALRDRSMQLANQVALCERTHGVVFSRGTDGNRSITGATYPLPTAGEVNAAATRCIARANNLQQELSRLRANCVARGCK
jgi:hypothetical protein